MIILIGAEKGGTGKTVMTVNLAAFRALQGKNVIIIDTDKQTTATHWVNARSRNDFLQPKIDCQVLQGEDIGEKIISLKDRYDDIFIDTRGSDAVELRASLLVADYFLTPVRSAQFDMWTLKHVESLYHRATGFNEKLRSGIVLNLAKARSKHTANAEREMKELQYLQYTGVVILDRDVYHSSQPGGGSVFEAKKRDKKAEFEMAKIHQVIYEQSEKDIETLIKSVRDSAGRIE